MRFGSVCSGIEAASVAFEPLGWSAAWLAEIEPFPSAVLAHHYPDVPNLGDMTAIPRRVLSGEIEAPDMLCGGTPCQAFSVAGLRESLSDERGNLTLTFVEIADAIDHVRARRGAPPAIILWENVPGVLSTRDNAFGCFLAGLAGEDDPLEPPGGRWANAGAVYGPARAIAWRTLDAQYFGLAQRRRRVFVVASAREGFDPATVLFEWDGLRRDSAPSRDAGKVAPTIPSRSLGGGGLGTDFDCDGGLIARAVSLRGREGGGTAELGDDVQNCLRASGGGGDKPHVLLHADPIARCDTAGEAKRQDWETCNFVAHSLRGEGFDASEDGTVRGTPLVPVNVCPTLRAGGNRTGGDRPPGTDVDTADSLIPIAFNARQDPDHWHDRTGPLDTDGGTQAVSYAIQAGALRTNPASGPDGVGVQADHAYTLEARAEVQAVAVRDVAQTVTSNYGKQCDNSDTALGPNVAIHSMQVRRLTPRECERLQGFPEIVKTCTITVFKHSNSNVCPSDQQSTNVLAALQSHKSPSNASPAEENVFPSNANAAELILNAGQENSNAPVLVNAQIDLERQHLHLHSQGKLLLSASIADASEWCRLPIQAEDFVQLSVALLACLEKTAPTGRAALHLNTSGSFPLLIGNWFASQSGREIEELASDAEKFMSAVKKCTTFITSEAGRNFQNYDSNLQTLLCCVSTVISSFIQSGILSASSYALSIEVSHGYTLIPWRKKPADHCPDGPRYRALGNSWAVPCVRWIGRRIQRQIDRKAA